jgi:hypothetical protein
MMISRELLGSDQKVLDCDSSVISTNQQTLVSESVAIRFDASIRRNRVFVYQ